MQSTEHESQSSNTITARLLAESYDGPMQAALLALEKRCAGAERRAAMAEAKSQQLELLLSRQKLRAERAEEECLALSQQLRDVDSRQEGRMVWKQLTRGAEPSCTPRGLLQKAGTQDDGAYFGQEQRILTVHAMMEAEVNSIDEKAFIALYSRAAGKSQSNGPAALHRPMSPPASPTKLVGRSISPSARSSSPSRPQTVA